MSNDERVFLIYRGEERGSYPAGLISVEKRDGANMAVRLGISTLLPDSMANTLVNGEQLTPDNFDELTGGISGGGGGRVVHVGEYVLGDDTTSPLTATADEESITLGYPLMNTATGEAESGSVEIPAATGEAAGVMTADDKAKLDGMPRVILGTIPGFEVDTPIRMAGSQIQYDTVNPTTGAGATGSLTIPNATASKPGLMAAGDKAKLDGMPAAAKVVMRGETVSPPYSQSCEPVIGDIAIDARNGYALRLLFNNPSSLQPYVASLLELREVSPPGGGTIKQELHLGYGGTTVIDIPSFDNVFAEYQIPGEGTRVRERLIMENQFDALAENVLKKYNEGETQYVRDGLALEPGAKLLLQTPYDYDEPAISIGVYPESDPYEYPVDYVQTELGSEEIPLCLKHRTVAYNQRVVGKNILVKYKDLAGEMHDERIAYLSDLRPGDWSLDEADTGATFVDGKKIYRRTVSCGTLPNATLKAVAHGIANIDLIVQISGMAYDGTSCVNLPNVSVTPSNAISCYSDRSNINITTGVNRSSFTLSYITLYYTCTDR